MVLKLNSRRQVAVIGYCHFSLRGLKKAIETKFSPVAPVSSVLGSREGIKGLDGYKMDSFVNSIMSDQSGNSSRRRRPAKKVVNCFAACHRTAAHDAFVCDKNLVSRTTVAELVADNLAPLSDMCFSVCGFLPDFVDVNVKSKVISIPDRITKAALMACDQEGNSQWYNLNVDVPVISSDLIDPEKKYPYKVVFSKADSVDSQAFPAVKVGSSMGLIGDWLSTRPFNAYSIQIFDSETWIQFSQDTARRPCLERCVHSLIKAGFHIVTRETDISHFPIYEIMCSNPHIRGNVFSIVLTWFIDVQNAQKGPIISIKGSPGPREVLVDLITEYMENRPLSHDFMHNVTSIFSLL